MVSSHLVELAIYSAYYPMFDDMGSFPSTLQIRIPAAFTVVSRGDRLRSSPEGAGRVETWRASIPALDIPIVASDQLQTESMRVGTVDVSVFFHALPPDAARAALREASASLDYFTHEFGPPSANALRVVFSPRGGWGYSRSGLIVVSEERRLGHASEGGPAGPPDENLHDSAHEISHFWWHVASTQGVDDWINGGARGVLPASKD